MALSVLHVSVTVESFPLVMNPARVQESLMIMAVRSLCKTLQISISINRVMPSPQGAGRTGAFTGIKRQTAGCAYTLRGKPSLRTIIYLTRQDASDKYVR